MSPKEWDFFFQLVSASMERAYKRGYDDAKEKKPEVDQGFTLSPESRLTIKTKLNKYLQNR